MLIINLGIKIDYYYTKVLPSFQVNIYLDLIFRLSAQDVLTLSIQPVIT